MAGIGDLFGKGSIAEQFLVWGVLQQLLQPLMAPALNELGNITNSDFPVAPLSPDQLAGLVARKFVDEAYGAQEAKKSGISPDNFASLAQAAVNAPSVGTIVAALQRGLIDTGQGDPTEVSFTGALANAGIRTDWWPILEKLTVQIPSVAEVMNAWLEGQIGEAEARTRYLAAGGDPTWFQTSYNANGQAPTPAEALELLNRGIIPETGTGPESTSYEQAFLEGPWRNKWLKPFLALREYYPPPRTVTAMYHDGQLTQTQAAEYLAKQGLSAQLIAAYLAPKATAGSATEKHLAKTDIEALYRDQLISAAQAEKDLQAINYSAVDAGLIVKLWDVRLHAQQVGAQVTRTRTLYLDGKITKQQALDDLHALGVDQVQAEQVVATWDVTQVAATRTLTAGEIASAYYYQVMTVTEAMDRLQSLGYDEADAYIVLSVRAHGPIPGVPVPAGVTLPPKPAAGGAG